MATSHNSAPLADLVAQIRPFIRQMQHSISVAHASAQQTLTDLGGDIAGCNAIKTTGEAEASSLETARTSHSNDHKSCRTREKTTGDELDGCQDTLDALESATSTSCQLYEDAKQTPGCGGIPATAGETWESYVARAAIYFADERDSFMHKKAVCKNNTAKLEDKKKKCLGSDATLRKLYDDTKQECHNTQTQLESTTCSYVSKVNSTCNSFATCANALADSFDAQTSGMEALETQRKVEWNATERLLCLLDVYGSVGDVDATRLQTCQHIGDNTSHLTLVYPTPIPRPSPCAALMPHPCDADYTQAEYGSLDAPAGNCTPCAWASAPRSYVKVSGDLSCTSEGLQDYDGDAAGCRSAAESVGYDFSFTEQHHAVPVIHDPDKTYKRVCTVCENMIYSGRPSLLFYDQPSGPTACDQDGQQTKFHICEKGGTGGQPTVPPPQAQCETFDFNSQTHCYPASRCSPCAYDFVDNGDGTRDFGNIRCEHHRLFYSKKSIAQSDLPFGYKFRCDHLDNLHFGLRSMNNRNWAQMTWRDPGTWKYNMECQSGSLK